VLSIPHKNEPYECVDDRIHTSFDIAEGFASNLFVSKTGICEICKESPPSKAFSLTEGRYNIGYDENVAYHEIDWALYNRGAMRTILWQVIDKKGNALLGKYLGVGGEEGKAQRSYDRTTYNGGNYVRITPLTFEAGAQSHELSSARYERFAFYKEVADLAYYGEKGDKVSLYQGENEADGGTDDTEVLREQPWTIGGSFSGHGPFEYNKLEAEIVEVIEGPLHAPDVFNSLTPDYFLISIGLDDDYSPFGKIIHPFCGEIPVDYRAVILRTNPKRKGFSRYILALKGSNYNRSDWIHTDIPQYFGAIPEQYRFSKKVAEYVEKINNWPRGDGQPLTVVGHSLGGGMAQYIVGTNRAESSFAGTWMDNDRRSSTQSMNSTRMSRQGTWWGFAFNPATLGTGTSAEVAFASRSDTPMSRFTVIRNSNDIVSNAAGRLLGNIWVLESGGHSLGSMDLTRILTVLPAPSQKFSLDASANLTISSPPLLPGFVNQQFADLDKP